MSIRDILKKREEARDAAQNGKGGVNDGLPEGVTRYVKAGSFGELNKEGKTLVMLSDPDNFYFYFVHESKTYDGKKTVHDFRKHTCLNSPREANADLANYFKPNGDVCPSCKSGAKRKLFALIPVFDPQYGTWRVIDFVEFHFNNIITDYDKLEKAARKFDKSYTLVGDAVHIKQVDKSFALEAGDLEDESILEAAKAFIGIDYGYADLAHFREVDDIIGILNEAIGGVDLAKLAPPKADVTDEM